MTTDTSCPYCIVIADDHWLFRRDLRKILERKEDLRVIGEAGDGLELMELLKKETPHLAIVDISMPNLNGIDAASRITEKHPDVSVLMLTMHRDEEYLQQAMSAGARGYLLKEDIDSDVFSAIDAIRNGGTYFKNINKIV